MADRKHVIYVVDDESVIVFTVAAILTKAGYLAKGFDKPQEALTAAAELAPDLLLTDVVMPGMTGIELAIHFRQSYPACKILLFSGQSDTNNLLESARGNGYEFELLAKSLHPTDLLARISRSFEI